MFVFIFSKVFFFFIIPLQSSCTLLFGFHKTFTLVEALLSTNYLAKILIIHLFMPQNILKERLLGTYLLFSSFLESLIILHTSKFLK